MYNQKCSVRKNIKSEIKKVQIQSSRILINGTKATRRRSIKGKIKRIKKNKTDNNRKFFGEF